MEYVKSGLAGKHKHLLDYLKNAYQQKLNVDIRVEDSTRHGEVQIREGLIVSAYCGLLHGNGAILTLVQMDTPRIEAKTHSEPVQKTVYFTIQQIERFLAALKATAHSNPPVDEEAVLLEAKLLFFQFRYKLAVEKLVSILRYNRFFYPAWLWQSRILTRQDYISKALDEAYRWGNHDQDIWRESRKIRPQLGNGIEPVKRCIFCWSILSKDNSCDHCKAFLIITGQPHPADLKQEEIKVTLSLYEQALQNDKNNSRTAYSLALGNFNLKEYQRALMYLRLATKLSPQSAIYKKSLSLLLTIARTHSDSKQYTKTSLKENSPGKRTILMIEDSQTSRKVLSMLFKRLGYTILEAATGAAALAAASENKPDLVLLDVVLPDVNGHDLLPKLRVFKHLCDTPVIMLTGKHDSNHKMLGIQAGISEYVTKPFNPHKLTELVKRYLPQLDNVVSLRESPDSQASVTRDAEKVLPEPVSTAPASTFCTQQAGLAITTSAEEVSSSSSLQPKNGKKSIFVIEDSQTSRKVLSMILGRHGFDIYEAATGQEAIQLAHTIQPDLVLLDVMLPDMTGYTILPQLKQVPHFENLPVIMLTGKRAPSDRMKGMLAGTNEYLTKPFNPEKLLSIIGGYI
jgi:twitching motility two-component system response regulator PilG